MLKNKLIISLLFLTPFIGFSQSIPNSSFEQKGDLVPYYPSTFGQANMLKDWESIKTADWFYNNFIWSYNNYGCSQYGENNMYAQHGYGYIGLGPCEAVQAKLTSKIPKYKVITISFWWSPRCNVSNTEINVYLMKTKANNNSLDNCYNPNFNYSYKFTQPVIVEGTNAPHKAGTWYQFISEPVIVVDDVEWLLVKGENDLGDGDSDKYVFLDNFNLSKEDYCDNYCYKNDNQPIAHSTPPQAMCGNRAPNDSNCPCFAMIIENANEITFRVFNNWGQLVYLYECFDIHGLKDPGFDDFLLEWHGNGCNMGWGMNNFNNSCNNNALPQGLYVYTLEMKRNCTNIKTITRPLLIFPPEEQPILVPEFKFSRIINCCDDNNFFQDTSFNAGYYRKDVDLVIKAGKNVNSSKPNGDVIVKNGANVIFQAGQVILLEDGFETLSGANFLASIKPCASSPFHRKGDDEITDDYDESFQRRLFYRELIQNKQNSISTNVNIYPNPTIGIFTIEIPEITENTTLKIYNTYGQLILQQQIINSRTQIDLSFYGKGLYVLQISNAQNHISTNKVLVQ